MEFTIDVTPYYHQLYCLKRDFALSNLPIVGAIKQVTVKEELMRVVEINLFNPVGEVFLLELWNENAVEGVKFLWDCLGDHNEVLFRVTHLDPSEPLPNKKVPMYKLEEPTAYQKSHKMYPIKQRIIEKRGTKGVYSDLNKQFIKIEMNNQLQFMYKNEAVRDIAHWHQTIEAQQESNHPDEFQQLIYRTTALSTLGKRATTDTNETVTTTVATKKVNKGKNNTGNTESVDGK